MDDIMKQIAAFGELKFNETHHAWLRHLKIEFNIETKTSTSFFGYEMTTSNIVCHFIGILCSFTPIVFGENMELKHLTDALKDKATLLNFLERGFQYMNHLLKQRVEFEPDSKYNTEYSNTRFAFAQMLYLDFMYAQGFPSV